MLRKFLRWLLGESDTHLLLKAVLEQQASVTKSVMDASQKQSDVLMQYLDLFKPKVGEDPRVWTDEPDNEVLKEEMARMGFPVEKSSVDQAEWVLENLGKMERGE